MRICRFDGNNLGLIDPATPDKLVDVTSALAVLPAASYPFPRHDVMIEHLDLILREINRSAKEGKEIALSTVTLESPVANPGKLVAAPVNYAKHLQEVHDQAELHHQNEAHMKQIQEIGLFLKATSSLIGQGQPVQLRMPERRNDHEIELAVIMGKTGSNIKEEQALDYIAGYTIGLDMTIRGPEERSLRKSLDSYSVLGPWMVTADEIPDPSNLNFELKLNGETRQKANTKDLVLSVPELIAFASRFYTLHPGDIIFTGTPEGVGPVGPGDVMHCTFDVIGEMFVNIVSADKEAKNV